MSIRLMNTVFDSSESRLADRLVLLVIADRSDDEGKGCFRGRESIAQMAGVSPRQVTESVRRLREMGELEVIERPGQSNLYRVTLAGSATPLAESSTPPSRICQTALAESSTYTSIDPSLIHIPSLEIVPEKTSSPSFKDEFEDWWSLWPRKIDKANARQKYVARRRAGASHEDLCTARDHYVVTVDDVRYCKHAATFLAPETWTEWLTAPVTTSPYRPHSVDDWMQSWSKS